MYTNFDDILELARQKLIASRLYNPIEKNQLLAVLGQRFGLEIRFGHLDTNRFLESSIASHLRVCITTTEDRRWTYTTYPSEPFLSCAAAYLLHSHPGILEQTLYKLEDNVVSGMVDIGRHGELIGRLLWLLAKDLFVIREKKSRAPSGFPFSDGFDTELSHCSMMPVVKLFKFVFGKDFWSSRAGRAAMEAFKDAYVNFSHWIFMDSLIRQDDGMEDQLR
jgi:hypothetical protein